MNGWRKTDDIVRSGIIASAAFVVIFIYGLVSLILILTGH
jgi:hypothetical protein